MASGTFLNNVFAARIHKSNAIQVKEDAALVIDLYTRRLIVLAAATPTPDEKESLAENVADLVEELMNESWRDFCAEYIINHPDDCIDELEDLPSENKQP